MKKLSLIISCYNEEAVLDMFYDAYVKFRPQITWDHELIFVNDGSTDKSYQILQRIAAGDRKVKVVNFSRNYGHEAAMIAGIDNASGDGLICMDADLQHPLECIPDIIRKFEEGYEVISMVRLANKSAGLIKNITSSGFYKVINTLSDQAKFEENASDFFAISSRVADVLRTNYREKVRFLRGYVQSVGFPKTTLTYTAADRAGGQSHYSIKKLIKFSISTIVSFSDLPLKLGIAGGIISSILALIMLIVTLCNLGTSTAGLAGLGLMISLLFAGLFFVVGIVGEYLAVMFAEMKDRPIYLVQDRLNFDDDHRFR